MNYANILIIMLSTLLISIINIPEQVKSLGFSWRKTAVYSLNLCADPCYSEIIPGLYLSNARAACNGRILNQLNITHILTIETTRIPPAILRQHNITGLFISATDSPSTNIMPYFPMANRFIEKGLREGNVLVHCHLGVSRSATLIIAYVMQKYGMTYREAFTLVRQKRKFINPNPGFREQLEEYYRLNYNVGRFQKMGAWVHVVARQHKYALAAVAVVLAGIIIPVAVLVG